MPLEQARSKVVVTTSQGIAHVPFTLYLGDTYLNPNTIAVAYRALRVLQRLADAFDIDLAARALEGLFLTEAEKAALKQLVFHTVHDIHAMSDSQVRDIARARQPKTVRRSRALVSQGTAIKQLTQIAKFLEWYHRKVLHPRLPAASVTAAALKADVEACIAELNTALGSPKALHPHKIRSTPAERFLQIYSKVFLRADDVLKSTGGKIGRNVQRDRAMVLLAAEGLRPGALGNIALADFVWAGGLENGYIKIRDNAPRRAAPITTATPRQKGIGSLQAYNSEMTVSIWPTTASAIQAYIEGERRSVTSRTLRNRSRGFLFLADHGGPIENRGTITTVFARAGKGLQKLKLLAKDPKDPHLDGGQYTFTAYLLRHSSASLFYASKVVDLPGETVEDLMKERYGWSKKSTMPSLYARRALSDSASLTVDDFISELLSEAKRSRTQARVGVAA